MLISIMRIILLLVVVVVISSAALAKDEKAKPKKSDEASSNTTTATTTKSPAKLEESRSTKKPCKKKTTTTAQPKSKEDNSVEGGGDSKEKGNAGKGDKSSEESKESSKEDKGTESTPETSIPSPIKKTSASDEKDEKPTKSTSTSTAVNIPTSNVAGTKKPGSSHKHGKTVNLKMDGAQISVKFKFPKQATIDSSSKESNNKKVLKTTQAPSSNSSQIPKPIGMGRGIHSSLSSKVVESVFVEKNAELFKTFEKGLKSASQCKGENINVEQAMKVVKQSCNIKGHKDIRCLTVCYYGAIGLFTQDHKIAKKSEFVKTAIKTGIYLSKQAKTMAKGLYTSKCIKKFPKKGSKNCKDYYKGLKCGLAAVSKVCK